MKTRKLLAGLMATALIATLMMAAAIPTFAATDGKIKIATSASGNASETVEETTKHHVKYKGYNIFTATVNADGTVSDLDWAGSDAAAKTAMKNLVKGIIQAHAGTYAAEDPEVVAGEAQAGDQVYTSDNPQKAAEYLAAATGADSSTQTTILENADILNQLAYALNSSTSVAPTKRNILPGTEVNDLQTGYWLFLTEAAELDEDNEIATAPIYTVVSSTVKTVSSKASSPVVTKTTNNQKAVDAQVGDVIPFVVTGTLPSNYATFDEYFYKVTDTINTNALKIKNVNENVVVKIVNGATSTVVKSGFTMTPASGDVSNGSLVIAFEDLNACRDANNALITVNANSVVRVEYSATLTSDAVEALTNGKSTTTNTAELEYSNDPNTTGTGTSTGDTDWVYAYKLHLDKVDEKTGRKILTASTFTIKRTDGTYDQYVNADGSLATAGTTEANAYKFSTGTNGYLEAPGLDTGTYTIKEISAPTSYKLDSTAFTVTIGATHNQTTGDLLTLTNTVAGNTNARAGLDTTPENDTFDVNSGVAAVLADGTVNATFANRKTIPIPISGQAGILIGVIVGCAILGISIAAMRKNKANAKA